MVLEWIRACKNSSNSDFGISSSNGENIVSKIVSKTGIVGKL